MQTMAWNSKDLIEMYSATNSGHFFDPDTMRFFKSRVTDNYRRLSDTAALFITTERGPSGVTRKATIRRAELVAHIREDGRECQKIKIETVFEFNTVSLAQAKRVMAKL